MPRFPLRFPLQSVTLAVLLVGAGAVAPTPVAAQSVDLAAAMHWREIGPLRAGRARALSGVATQPNVFYIGFDNGGVWRSGDYGASWQPLFDRESTGSIGAIAVAPSDPNVVYVGSGAGIIRPDLATGDGMYRSTDAGRTWTHLGLRESQMIAHIDVDPRDPNRLFVAVLGHPYGPNAERGIFRSTDGGQSFQKVLYKDEYTSGNDVRIDPRNPNVVYATLWQQQQSFIEGQAFGGSGNGIFKSTDGGATWTQLTDGLPAVIQANIAVSPSNPNVLYAAAAGTGDDPNARSTTGVVGFYRSTDAGARWQKIGSDPRPMGRIGGGDLPTILVDPTNERVVYSSSTVFWRTENGGETWSAVRGAPGGDDYQKTWINPNNPDIILSVTDQGAVVSANRGVSWSNWFTQPTAAMYHVTTDLSFPYRVCGGQQDSGSACVESRSMDGRITFRNWHPVNIQEYGIAAPDPRDPDIVYGSSRNNVTRFDRRTGQVTLVGPDMSQVGPKGERYNRNVRTMPLHWSPVNPDVLYYASNAVWRTRDRGKSWTRISPDLARQTWPVPASAGKYASTVTPTPTGVVTALAPSPRGVNILWAGTDDGNIQTTADGGATWRNVTPPGITPWTRIFNIEAGHFDDRTAYAAANTLRVDDLNPHFWRTHDGGRTWTEINTGIAGGAVANSIREDPRVPGLLYASTDTQVWVSYDDGAHWESLRIDMPAISVRDIRVKDDTTCWCADLVAGTHGRGYWILDNITPLRQAAQVRRATASGQAALLAPAPAVRVRFATNDPTALPPDVPGGESAPTGASIDYFLPRDASGPVTLEILDAAGAVIRRHSSAEPVANPHPALDPVAYDRVCQQNPAAEDCALPLYWPAPPIVLSARQGMHRFQWDMRFDAVRSDEPLPAGGDDAVGAVPHRTYPDGRAPWAPPGRYTVRLTVDGVRHTQPLMLRLDPRVRTPAADLARLHALTRSLYTDAVASRSAYEEARALSAALQQAGGADADALRAKVDSLAPPPQRGGRFGARRAAPGAPASLDVVSSTLTGVMLPMQTADVGPTSVSEANAARAKAQFTAAMSRWTAIGRDLAALNRARRAAGQPAIAGGPPAR